MSQTKLQITKRKIANGKRKELEKNKAIVWNRLKDDGTKKLQYTGNGNGMYFYTLPAPPVRWDFALKVDMTGV